MTRERPQYTDFRPSHNGHDEKTPFVIRWRIIGYNTTFPLSPMLRVEQRGMDSDLPEKAVSEGSPRPLAGEGPGVRAASLLAKVLDERSAFRSTATMFFALSSFGLS